MNFKTYPSSFRGAFAPLFVLLLVSCVPFCTIQASSLSCHDIFGPTMSQSPIHFLETPENIFRIEQASTDILTPFFFRARYLRQNGGSLELNIWLVDRIQNMRSSIRGQRAYDKMMQYFSNNKISYIVGTWSRSDNSREYMNNIERLHMTKEEAALNTWSGRQAQKYGYRYPQIIFDGLISEKSGVPYRQTEVRFYKQRPTYWQKLKGR